MKIKVCGLFREQDIDYVNILKPSFIGFVFAKSKREVKPSFARILKSKLNDSIKAIGVFVNSDIDFILNLIDSNVISLIQLHGDENNDFIENLKSKRNIIIIKAIKVNSVESILKSRDSLADFLLFDNLKGGSGESFNWDYLSQAQKRGFKREYFLAGGLNVDNIQQALSLKPYCVDISGGLETNGIKDFNKMKSFIYKVRGIHNE
ncbi:phosphoribosylanthranilate isomerase [Helicobacter sp. MIT 14-3879]|uniref:phosphoribosylanthranilate isomerase n=1 Tax=Helicobacter sp. MIT 14-3879 TaxID=2040649 RepID=UPI000E1EAD9E|nr:phosphoribosylanthranilate isomerase [Helicobacter sp. MIT 14-3879]RDU62853.1 N-(5'-phosphoribosyl)anthranilate isomerase [Helicobacter sp. MIT 14-3879]